MIYRSTHVLLFGAGLGLEQGEKLIRKSQENLAHDINHDDFLNDMCECRCMRARVVTHVYASVYMFVFF